MRRNGAGAWGTAEGTESNPHFFGNFTVLEMQRVVGGNQRTIALNHQPFLRVVKRDDFDLLLHDILPNIALGPIGERKYAHGFAFVDGAAVERPQFRPLPSRIPLAECVS